MQNVEIANQIVMKSLGEIRPYIRNPRKNEKTVQLLVEIIPQVGFNVPIVIDEKGIIVKGHSRYYAAIKLGMEKVPCIITHADEEHIKLDRLADNKISEFSEWVNDELLHELDALNIEIPADLQFPTLPTETLEFNNDDFNVDEFLEDEDEESSEDLEEKKRKQLEFMEAQKKAKAPDVSFVNEKDIERAEAKQQNEGGKQPRYFKCICSHCGNVMFVSEKDIWTPDSK